MNGRCCVFQPFDKGTHDKRYQDIVDPAIRAGNLEPYRVDRDDGATIPIETLHEEIRSATLCLADITTRNPSVMYEVGYAIASRKDVILICAKSAEKFPFDIQHRGIIQYEVESVSDFEKLKQAITARINALIKKQATAVDIAAASPVKGTHGLKPYEVAALAFILSSVDGVGGISAHSIKSDMEKAGFNRAAAQLGLLNLTRKGMVEPYEDSDYNGNESWTAYRLTTVGEDWLLENEDQLELRLPASSRSASEVVSRAGVGDDDVPF